MPDQRLREARRAAGLNQAELAERAGVSRQLVGAIEAGRHRPGVDAALSLARAVDRSVETLFAGPVRPAVQIFPRAAGQPAADGSAVLAARVGDGVVYAPARAAFAAESWEVANAVLEEGEPHALPGADLDGFVVVGCDPALGLAAALAPGAGPRRLLAVGGSTAGGLMALSEGRAHAVLVHGPAHALPTPPHDVVRLHLARWRVGVGSSRPRRGASAVSGLEGLRAPVVQREPGASSQQAFLRALARRGLDPPGGPVATGHLDVARRVAAGARGGVTFEPAALAHGLGFHSLEEHTVQIWIDARWQDHPGAQALGELLGSSGFRARLGLVDGYDLTNCGSPAKEAE